MTLAHSPRFGLAAAVLVAFGLGSFACSSTPDDRSDAGSSADAGSHDAGTSTDAGTKTDGGTQTGNHDFDTAKSVTIDSKATSGKLTGATGKDYFKFTGTAGERITIATAAQRLTTDNGANADDPTVIDTVVTVYDSSKQQIAQDDDEWPRSGRDSQVFLQIPADGTYYFTIEDCAEAFGSASCADPKGLKTFNYQVFVAHVSGLTAPEANAGAEQNGTTAKAVALPYMVPDGADPGQYSVILIDGAFKTAGETQVFSFTPPADTVVDMEAVRANFWVQPPGKSNGDGSTAKVKVWVTDSTGTNVIAKVDQNDFADGDNPTNGPINMSVPVELGQQYFLFVQSTAASASPATDYYFITHYAGNYYYGTPEVEAADTKGTNDTILTAETLAVPDGVDASYFVAGNLAGADDTDWFEVDAASTATVSIYCQAQRAGSGLRGLTTGLYTLDSNMMPQLITGTSATEAANADFAVQDVELPANTEKAFLKVTATSQDGDVTGHYYHCSVNYF